MHGATLHGMENLALAAQLLKPHRLEILTESKHRAPTNAGIDCRFDRIDSDNPQSAHATTGLDFALRHLDGWAGPVHSFNTHDAPRGEREPKPINTLAQIAVA